MTSKELNERLTKAQEKYMNDENMRQFVIYLFDYKNELIDNPIVEGRDEEDAYMRFRHSEEGQNPEIRGVSIREWKGCFVE